MTAHHSLPENTIILSETRLKICKQTTPQTQNTTIDHGQHTDFRTEHSTTANHQKQLKFV